MQGGRGFTMICKDTSRWMRHSKSPECLDQADAIQLYSDKKIKNYDLSRCMLQHAQFGWFHLEKEHKVVRKRLVVFAGGLVKYQMIEQVVSGAKIVDYRSLIAVDISCLIPKFPWGTEKRHKFKKSREVSLNQRALATSCILVSLKQIGAYMAILNAVSVNKMICQLDLNCHAASQLVYHLVENTLFRVAMWNVILQHCCSDGFLEGINCKKCAVTNCFVEFCSIYAFVWFVLVDKYGDCMFPCFNSPFFAAAGFGAKLM
ncbi:hypothetical protein Tco_0599117 [Tanacetum coccineum]